MQSPFTFDPITLGAPGQPTLDQALAEPSKRSGQWTPSVIRRILMASAAPVALGATGVQRNRLEEAGWFIVEDPADAEAARKAAWPAIPELQRIAWGYGSPRPAIVFVAQDDSLNSYPLA